MSVLILEDNRQILNVNIRVLKFPMSLLLDMVLIMVSAIAI